MEDAREVCCKNDCDSSAIIVLKVYTEGDKPTFLPFCMNHLLDAAGVIENIVTDMINVIKDTDNKE